MEKFFRPTVLRQSLWRKVDKFFHKKQNKLRNINEIGKEQLKLEVREHICVRSCARSTVV